MTTINQNTEKTEPLSKRVVRGGAWAFALSTVNKGLGFIRTIILARLLSPDDFGLLGIVMLTISTLETFSQTGFQAALIQKKGDVRPYLDTAWTVLAVRGIILFLMLFLSAPLVGKFFNSPQAILVIRVIAVSTLLSGFRNIGVFYFQKELEFNKQFIYEFSATVVDLAVSVFLAFMLRSVWALVWGGLAAHVIRLIISYVIHPYRPRIRIDKEKFQDLFGFGRWILGSSILIFLIIQGDDIFVGKILGITALGFYRMAYKLSNLPATEITHIISQVSFPAYSKMQDNMEKLKETYLKVLRLTALLSFPLAGGIFIFALQFTQLFLGDKWMPMVPAMQVLCFYGVIRSIGTSMGPILVSLGKPKITTKLSGIQLIMIVLIIYPLTILWGIFGTALAVTISYLAALLMISIETKKMINFRYKDFLAAVFLPLSAAFLAGFAVVLINKNFCYDKNIVALLIMVVLFVITYSAIVYLFDLSKHKITDTIKEVLLNLQLNDSKKT